MTNQHLPDERVDRLLGEYFKTNIPAGRWPSAPRTANVRPANTTTDPAVRSRWALAASVAVLLGGCWYLSDNLTGGKARKGPGLDGGSADSKAVLKGLEKPKVEPKVGMP